MGEARVRSGLIGDPRLIAFNGVINDPNVYQTLISHTVVLGSLMRVYRVNVVCRFTGLFKIKKNGVIVGTGRTGPAESNVNFEFLPYLKAEAEDIISVEFCSRVGIPSGLIDLEAYIHAGEIMI